MHFSSQYICKTKASEVNFNNFQTKVYKLYHNNALYPCRSTQV